MFSVSFGGRVVKVYDGDTIEVEVKRTVRIRLLDLWCPEVKTTDPEEKAKGIAAREFLKDAIEGGQVKVTVPIEGDAKFGESLSFGRVLGKVETESGIDISEFMRAAGHGTLTKGGE